jgi:hypothetical protein
VKPPFPTIFPVATIAAFVLGGVPTATAGIYRGCQQEPGGVQGLYVKLMSCRAAVDLLSPSLGPGSPPPKSFAARGYRCAVVGRSLADNGGGPFRVFRCTRNRGRIGFEYLAP